MRLLDIKGRGETINIYIDPEKTERIAVRSDKFGYICIFAAAVAWAIAYISGYKKEAHYKNYIE